MLVNSKFLLEKAMKEGRAVPAVTIIDEHGMRGVVRACEEMELPCILATGKTRENLETFAPLMAFLARRSKLPIVMHLDHGKDLQMVKWAIASGFTSVMFDGSTLPFEENVRQTAEIVEYAHARGIPVEAELGHVGNGADYEKESKKLRSLFTQPDQALEFIRRTGVDSLAVAVGTAHGEYAGEPRSDFQRLAQLRAAIPIPLVLHGGSGTGKEMLRKAVENGINKVNLCTDIHKACRRCVQEKAGEQAYPDLCASIQNAARQVMLDYRQVFL